MFFVYILYSEQFDKYYIGHTDNPERRLLEHNEISESSFTSKYRPWITAACFAVSNDRGVAIKVEKHLKKQKSKTYLKDIIQRNSIEKIINVLSRCSSGLPEELKILAFAGIFCLYKPMIYLTPRRGILF